MKYLVCSDIHGSLPVLEKLLSHYQEMHCDQLLFIGDLLNYGPRNSIPEGIDPQGIVKHLNAMAERIIAVRGNCDSEVDQMLCDFDLMSDYTWIVDNGTRIFLTHGHVFGESHLPRAHFDILFNGHTHLPHITRLENGSVVVNTGSPTFPKGGNPPTFVIYEDRVVSLNDLEGTLLQSLHL